MKNKVMKNFDGHAVSYDADCQASVTACTGK